MKRMNATAIRDENVFDATMNAVIIYDECDFAAKANAMLERAAHRTDETTHWGVKLWRVDVLKLPPAAEAALAEAVEAHLIMLAVRQIQSLLPWLRVDWLERWARCRQVQEAALAVWDGENAATRSARAAPELSQFAGRHGLSLIFDDNALVEGKSSMFVSDLHEREVSLSPTLQHILEQPVRD
jgi:hypothetical protein